MIDWNKQFETIKQKIQIKFQSLLFTDLLNRGAGDNSCYHPANWRLVIFN